MPKMSILWRSLVALVLLHESLSRKFSHGPSVDPGVFVITHISSCRNGAGYCILGFSCEVDKDFVKDDMGGHCTGLGEAFNPRASFVCCRENPALHPPKERPIQNEEDDDKQEIVIENSNLVTETSVVTEMVTEVVTEVATVTELVTNVVTEMVTEEIMVPGTVEDLKEPEKAQRLDDEGQYVLISSSNLKEDVDNHHPGEVKETSTLINEASETTQLITDVVQLMVDDTIEGTDEIKELPDSTTTSTTTTTSITSTTTTQSTTKTTTSTTSTTQKAELEIPEVGVEEALDEDLIKTSPNKLKPDRDDSFEAAVLNSQPINIPSATNNAGGLPEPRIDPRSNQCGRLGGAAVLQAFGRAAHNLLPDLVFSWVTGGQSNKKSPSARLDDDEEDLEPRIIAGDVTSTVLYCWLVAIIEKSKDGNSDQFICTGALVEPDLVVTSASCTLRMFETGVNDFHVVLGDSNLKIDLPFGVQQHEISQVIVHENYRPDDSFHYQDIGLIKLQTVAKMETTVCTLCLPETFKDYTEDNCTVVGYGRPSTAALNQFAREEIDQDLTDGILRQAELPIVDTIQCQEYLDVNARSDEMHSGFICAGGDGKEESCYIAMDGGSPLACLRGKDQYELAGLVTFGTSCAHDRSPSLFTNVSKHVRWIRENYENMKKRREN